MSEIARLQILLEREKKQGQALDREIKRAEDIFSSKQSSARQVASRTLNSQKLVEVETMLAVARKRLSSLKASNHGLKSEIDTHRHIVRASLSVSTSLSQSLKQIDSQVDLQQALTSRTQQVLSNIQSRVSSLRNSFEKESEEQGRTESLGRRERRKLIRRKREECAPEVDCARKDLMRTLVEKWKKAVTTKRQELHRHQCFTRTLQEAFQRMMDKGSVKSAQGVTAAVIAQFDTHRCQQEQLLSLHYQASLCEADLETSHISLLNLIKAKDTNPHAGKVARLEKKSDAVATARDAVRERLKHVRGAIVQLTVPLRKLREALKNSTDTDEDCGLHNVKDRLAELEPLLHFPSQPEFFVTSL